MPRRPRIDAPGMLHHVLNRGIARRTVFETRRDVRFFLALLACQVRAGRIEVLAYSILTTHFHLVVRSTTGELPSVMQRIMNRYVRYFNRTRKRDGPLFRARYRSIPVGSTQHLYNLFRYIDRNAPEARLAHTGEIYPFGSERWYRSPRRPPWLSTVWAEGQMARPVPGRTRSTYGQTFGRPLDPAEEEVLRRRIEGPVVCEDDWDALIGAAPPRILEWMTRKARLADGTRPGLPYAGADRVDRHLAQARDRGGEWTVLVGRNRPVDGWAILRVGLLRDLAGLTWLEIATRCNCNPQVPVRRIRHHAALLERDPDYRSRAAVLGAACLGRQARAAQDSV